jgi:ribosomal protein S18 acetylase RimI-like enzyme
MTSRLIAIFPILPMRHGKFPRAAPEGRSVGTAPIERKGRASSGPAGIQTCGVPGGAPRLQPMPPTHPAPSIRRATRADIDALLALEEATFDSDRISRAQWRRHIDSDTASVFVGGARGGVDAATVVFYRRGTRGARLYSLAVAAPVRGTGLGAALLARAEADAHDRGCTSMRLEVRADNSPAIALYERRGYARIVRLPRFYEDGADGWRYVKVLTTVTR